MMVRWYNIKKVDVLGFSTAYYTVYNPLQNSISCCFYYPCNTIMYTAQKHVGNCSYSQYDKWVRFVRPFYYSIILQCTANFTNTKFSNFTCLHFQKIILRNNNVFFVNIVPRVPHTYLQKSATCQGYILIVASNYIPTKNGYCFLPQILDDRVSIL